MRVRTLAGRGDMAFGAIEAKEPREAIIERKLCWNPRSVLTDESDKAVFDLRREHGRLPHFEAPAGQCPYASMRCITP